MKIHLYWFTHTFLLKLLGVARCGNKKDGIRGVSELKNNDREMYILGLVYSLKRVVFYNVEINVKLHHISLSIHHVFSCLK